MLNLSNEAIRRMYLACKENDCFPGELPTDEHDRNVSIHAILGGLGLLTDGMLPFDTSMSPSDNFSSRRQSQSNASGRPPRAESGNSDPSMDGIETSSFENGNGLPSRNSVHSSTSRHSFEDLPISPVPQLQTHLLSFNPGKQNQDTGPPFLHNLDFLSFDPQNNNLPMGSVANTTGNTMQPLPSDFLFPWPGTFAAVIGTTEYHQQY